jgi:hypothetical protein
VQVCGEQVEWNADELARYLVPGYGFSATSEQLIWLREILVSSSSTAHPPTPRVCRLPVQREHWEPAPGFVHAINGGTVRLPSMWMVAHRSWRCRRRSGQASCST